MRRTGNVSGLPAMGTVGCATSNAVRAGAALPGKAHPATAPTPMAAPVDSRFLRSIRLLRFVETGPGPGRRRILARRGPCYSSPHVNALLLCVLLVLAPPGG